MEKLSVWFCGLYTTPCLTGLLYGYDTVSISGAIDFLQDKYALSPALQGLVISSIMIGGVIGVGLARVLGPIVSAASRGAINVPPISGSSWAMALGLMVAIGLVVGALPAIRAMRLNIVDALSGR